MVEKLLVFLHIFSHAKCFAATSSVWSLARESPRCNKTAQMVDDASVSFFFFSVGKKLLSLSWLLFILFINSVGLFLAMTQTRKCNVELTDRS